MPHPSTKTMSEAAITRSFFYPHGIWAPGVRLMRNLSFGTKALIISVVFLIPVGILAYLLGTNQFDQIAFSAKERAGVVAMEQFVPIYINVLKTRNATRASLGGLDRNSQYRAGRDATDTALAAFGKYLQDSGDPLGLTKEYEALKAVWTATAQIPRGVDDKGRTVFGPVTHSLGKMLVDIGDNSNLVLDPDVDSFYLINTMVLTMPELAENIGQLWGWGTYAIAASQLGGKELRRNEVDRYTVWAAGVESGLRQSRAYLDRIFAANPNLKQNLNTSTLDEIAVFYETAKDPQALSNNDKLVATQFYDTGEAQMQHVRLFYDKGLPALDGLLIARIETMQHRLVWASAVTAALLILAAYLFYSFFLVTRGGLKLISQHLQEMAEGDLRRPPSTPWGKDEPAMVIFDLLKAHSSLHQLIENVRRSSTALHNSSDEIASASTDLSARTEAAAASLEEQSAAMEEISATVGATAERAQLAANFSADNAKVAEKGGMVISQVVTTMRNIHASSAKISDIIGVIDGIAFQTNILALNAAVEAARAGESGRGFAVVASEVRNLAHRSAEAAREIKSLISTSVDQVQTGTRIVEEAGQTMVTMLSSAKQINAYLAEIATASREQAAGVEQVGHSVQQLDKNTQQNAALVEETMAASASLRQQSDALQNEISNFILS